MKLVKSIPTFRIQIKDETRFGNRPLLQGN